MAVDREILFRLATSQTFESAVRATPFGEQVTDIAVAEEVTAGYLGLADEVNATPADAWLSVDLSHLGLDVDPMGCADRLTAIAVRLSGGRRIQVGAEDHSRAVEPGDRALPFGEPTDIAYLRLAHWPANAGAEFALATHDGVLREALLAALGPRPVEQLLGVRPEVIDDLVARGIPVRAYVPFGDNWFRYWMRRVAESRGT